LTRRIKLKTKSEQPIFIFGLISTENLLKLTWSINQSFGIELSQADPIAVHDIKSGQTSEFSLMQFEDENSQIKWSLIVNRSKPFSFLSEFKNIDYLFFVSSNDQKNKHEQVIIELKKIKEITSALPIDHMAIKRKDRIESFYI
jgi:hypothetical protein